VRWARRRPAAAALLAVSGVAALALGGLIVCLFYNVRLSGGYQSQATAHPQGEKGPKGGEKQREKGGAGGGMAGSAKQGEEQQRKTAEAARDRAQSLVKERDAALGREQRTSYFHSILLADLALKENNIALAQVRLKECNPELRNWEWRYLDAQCHT